MPIVLAIVALSGATSPELHDEPEVTPPAERRTLVEPEANTLWSRPGFRADLGYAFVPLWGLGGLEDHLLHTPAVRLGFALNEDWLIAARAAYGIGSGITRSERMRGGVWVPYDFERMHRVQLVGSARFPGGWELGARVTFQTGQPVTTAFGYNDGRSASELRFDVRVDKRMTWDDFMLDFYVDIMNVGVGTETLTLSSEDAARYVLPSLGLRAVF